MPKHPLQPLISDEHGVLRFKRNEIVRFLLDNGGIDLNSLSLRHFTQEDREQFAQLIGYSLVGFGELSYVSDDTYNAAKNMTEEKSEIDARIEALESTLSAVREGLKVASVAAFRIHPDDLHA